MFGNVYPTGSSSADNFGPESTLTPCIYLSSFLALTLLVRFDCYPPYCYTVGSASKYFWRGLLRYRFPSIFPVRHVFSIFSSLSMWPMRLSCLFLIVFRRSMVIALPGVLPHWISFLSKVFLVFFSIAKSLLPLIFFLVRYWWTKSCIRTVVWARYDISIIYLDWEFGVGE